MNIFFLDKIPVKAAEYHVDRHVIKMIQEIAHVLSMAHLILDGRWQKQSLLPAVYRNLCTLGWAGAKDYGALLLPGESIVFDSNIGWTITNQQVIHKVKFKASGFKDPCIVWAYSSIENYMWLYGLFKALLHEAEFRFGSTPNLMKLLEYDHYLSKAPVNLTNSGFTEPPVSIPTRYKVSLNGELDCVASYRRYYIGEKYRIAKWTGRSIPSWYLQEFSSVWAKAPASNVNHLVRFYDDAVSRKIQGSGSNTLKKLLRQIKKDIPDVYNHVVI